MKVEAGKMVALGYGKYFRSDAIVGLEPIEDERGPGKRTRVYVDGHITPLIASRSESTILRDLVEAPVEMTNVREQYELLRDIMDTLTHVQPMLRSIIRDQGGWDLDRLEEQLNQLLEPEASPES